MSNELKIAQALEILHSAEGKLNSAKKLLTELVGDQGVKEIYIQKASQINNSTEEDEESDTIVEGIFNGQIMIDKQGTEYPVPANYASKSKLVPGDSLKLTIKEDGRFLYKQIGPVERKRVIGHLTYEDGQYKVIASNKAYKVLLASVTYFRGSVGDKVTLVIPALEESDWGTIEHIIPQTEELTEF